jgi:TetR/AcrR family transcriptional regulator, cholesterol catabolism regulator
MTSELVSAKVADSGLVAQRHAQLVSAATELFLRQGFHETSVREIAQTVGWQIGTLYLYISRKQDILYLISQSVMSELWDGLRDLPSEGSAQERLEAAARYFFRAVDRKRREIKLIYRESASLEPEHLKVVEETELKERNLFATIIRDGVASGEFRPVDEVLIAHDIIILAHMWALKGWALRPYLDLDSYIDRQLEFIFRQL